MSHGSTQRTERSNDCPSRHDLIAFAIGDLSGARFDHVATHVSACRECEHALQEHDTHTDDLVDGLKQLPELIVDAGRQIARSLRSGSHRLDKFELLEELGAGSFGYVFKARDTQLDRIVAVKVQRAAALAEPEETARFHREAKSAARLEHPNIVSLYETGRAEDGSCYLVTELIEGTTLERSLREGRPDFATTARLVADLAEALHYAHGHGVVHRDVKPSNVLLDHKGRPHLTDFGLAKRELGDATMTPAGQVMGTPAYMSPELARGQSHAVDGRTDVYSLGVVLYELLTGRRPFEGKRRSLVLEILEDEPTAPRQIEPGVPRDLDTICMKAIAKRVEARYATAQELADDLRRFLRHDPIHARPLGIGERLWRWCRRNTIAASLLLTITLGSAIGFWHLTRLSTELTRTSARDSAAQYAEMLETVNDLYSNDVVRRVGHHDIRVTSDYQRRDGAIPLPATFLTVLLDRLGSTESGMRGRHYSEYPFRTRANGGPRDDFGRRALAALKARPNEAFYEFSELDDRPVLRYATARMMVGSCVECHNNHPDSIKTDWKVGDVRGVLEIIRPLDRDVARAAEGLRGTFALVAIASLSLLGLTVLVLVVRGSRVGGA